MEVVEMGYFKVYRIEGKLFSVLGKDSIVYSARDLKKLEPIKEFFSDVSCDYYFNLSQIGEAKKNGK